MKLKTFISIFLIIMVFASATFAQVRLRIKKSEFKVTDDGFKEAWKNIRKGNSQYNTKKRGGYQLAYDYYSKAAEYNADNAKLSYKLGVCAVKTGKVSKSLEYVKAAYDMNNYVTEDIHFWLARAYHLNFKFQEATDEYNTYRDGLSKRKLKKQQKAISKYIEECDNGKKLIKKPARVLIDNVGDGINTSFADFAPLFVSQDSVVIFTSRRDNTTGGKRNSLTNEFYEDIYYSHFEKSKWQAAAQFSRPVNKKGNDACVTISSDGKEMCIYRGGRDKGAIYLTASEGGFGEWSRPKKITRKINSKNSRETTLTFANDSSMVFFTSDRKGGYGGRDIWYSYRNIRTGGWKRPKNLGAVINTAYDEEFVYLSSNDSILYFSSKGHETMGGFDIFKTKLLMNGQWSEPVNIGYPINTPGDDMCFSISDDNRFGYYATIKDDGFGDFDIYSILFLGREKTILRKDTDDLIANVYKPVIEIKLENPESIKTMFMTLVKGTVSEFSTNKPLAANVDIVDLTTNTSSSYKTDPVTGAFQVFLPSGKNYSLTANADRYMFYSENFDIPAETKYNEKNMDIHLMPMFDGSKIVLKNVFFDTGKSNLRPDSYPELQRLASYFTTYPKLNLEISGHTDNVGSKASNKKLSKARAESVVQYLISIGVPATNLSSAGYADDQPVESNKTKEGRQMNRRVEAKVVGH